MYFDLESIDPSGGSRGGGARGAPPPPVQPDNFISLLGGWAPPPFPTSWIMSATGSLAVIMKSQQTGGQEPQGDGQSFCR